MEKEKETEIIMGASVEGEEIVPVKLTYDLVPNNFTYPEIKPSDYVFGSKELVGTKLREDGDWRDYTPPEEMQNKNGVESSACFIEAIQHSYATIHEEEFGLTDSNFSSRFNMIFASATPRGGSPLKGAQSIRDYGLIPEELLPFADYISSWEEFNSFKGGDQSVCRVAGQKWLKEWEPGYDIVVTRDMTIEQKYKNLKEALPYCPPPVSVLAWVRDAQGNYVKPEGEIDNHLVELVYIDGDNCPWIWDTYPPFLKRLTPFYNFDFGLRTSLKKKEIAIAAPKKNFWQSLTNFFKNFFK